MAKQTENPVTSQIVPLLRDMCPEWKFEEQQKPLKGSLRQPDIIAMRRGHETVAIEAKWSDSKARNGVTQVRERYLGRTLLPEFVGASLKLKSAMVVRYPTRLQEKPGAEITAALRAADDIESMLIGESSGEYYEFPSVGYARGTLADVANALKVGAVPSQHIAEASEKMEEEIQVAAKWLHDATETNAIIGDKLDNILEQDYCEQTARMACLIITNAFVFQHAVAGKPRMESVRPPAYYKVNGIKLTAVVQDWAAILKVNYQPIFKDARRMLCEAFIYDEAMANNVLEQLCDAACTLVESHLPQIHELAGEVFQSLLIDRKYVKANYTLPTSATLLSALVCPNLPDDGRLPKVADFACGTGALLNGVYKRIQRLYEERTGENSIAIHREMLENNLAGADIYSHCTHLTFAAMASAHPEVTLGATRVITAPHGETEEGVYKTGSLELLDNQLLFPTMESEGEQLAGDSDATAELKREFGDGEMDIVIQNPPFLTSGADPNSRAPKRVFASEGRGDAEQKAMLKELASKDTRVSNGQVAYSYFVELADLKLRDGGRMGVILPATILTSALFSQVREMWATEYHNVMVVTIAQKDGHDSAFSADTSMAECMVIADKGVAKNTGRATFVCLSQRPDSTLAAQALAENLHRQPIARQLEDEALGGDAIKVGDVGMAQVLECPIGAGEWGASRVKSMSLMQIAYQLRQGKLRLPELIEAIDIPICPLGEIGQVGASHRDIKDKDKRGAFEMHRRESNVQEGYDALWQLKYITPLRSMQVVPDQKAQIKPQNVEKAHRILRQHNSRTHYHLYLGFNANSVLAHWTEVPALGVNLVTNVKLEDVRYEAAWTLWTNSTFGMLCHWTTAGKQQPGRGTLTLMTLPNVPTLDVRQLSDAQLGAAERVLSDLKGYRLKPYNECADDAWRHILDARLLSEVLGITDAAIHRAMQSLRELLSIEPSISGTKKARCCYAEDRQKAVRDGIPYAYDDAVEARALSDMRAALSGAGIYLP